MTTIKDVAAYAGVSTATISNFLNDTKPVGKDTAKRISDAIEKLQYTPNSSARSLRSRAYSDIGVVLPDFDDPYYVHVFQGIESAFSLTDYYINIHLSHDISEYEQSVINSLLKKQIQGLIIISCQTENWKYFYNYLTSADIPLVLIDRNIPDLDTNFVSFDYFKVTKNLTESIIKNGYQNTVLFMGPEKFFCESQCAEGFNMALKDLGNCFPNNSIIETNLTKEDAFHKALTLMRASNPDSFVVTSETLASGVMESLSVLGHGMGDIPVFVLGEDHWNRNTHSFARTMALKPSIKIGQTAAELMLNQLNSPHINENQFLILEPDEIPVISIKKKSKRQKKTKSIKGSLKILFMDTPQVHSLLDILKNFEVSNGITIEADIIPHYDIYRAIHDSHEGNGKSYDIFMYDIPWLSSLASSGVLHDISNEISDFNPSKFLSNSLKHFSYFEQKYYGIPFMYAPQILYYRKDLFEDSTLRTEYSKLNKISLRPPVTLKEYLTIGDFFTNKTDVINYGISVSAAYDECLVPEIYMRIRAYGGKVFDTNGNVRINSDATLKAYINLIRSTKVAKPDYRVASDTSIVKDFLSGETAMLISYPTFLADTVDLRKGSMTGTIGYHHIPGHSPILGGWSLGISSNSGKKDWAIDFFKWLCDDQIAKYFVLLGGLSALSSTYTNDELNKLFPWLSLYHSEYSNVEPIVPPYIKYSKVIHQVDVDAIICKYVYDIFDEKIEVKEAITRTEAELIKLTERSTYDRA